MFMYDLNHFCVNAATFCALTDVDRSVAFSLSLKCTLTFKIFFLLFKFFFIFMTGPECYGLATYLYTPEPTI